MDYRNLGKSELKVSVLALGTWAFGNDRWWGSQKDSDSQEVLDLAITEGINLIDTAPVYGRGYSEKLIGSFIKKRGLREKIILATKLGLSWEGRNIFHNLKPSRMFEELDESRKRLDTDYFDLYQVHWPDPDTPIAKTAETMYQFYQKGIIKAVGVSNYSVSQIKEFEKCCPVCSLQPQYSMFFRDIEKETLSFCRERNIAVITYAPLYSGILSGKFFFNGVNIPSDINRKMKKPDLEEPRLSVNKEVLLKLRDIAHSYCKTLSQLALNWNFNQAGVTSVIAGMRKNEQCEDNLGSVGWSISGPDTVQINKILNEREMKIKSLKSATDS